MIILALFTTLILFIIAEALYIKHNGNRIATPTISRQEQHLGRGTTIRYAILGDSTTLSQGGDYQRGYAVNSARHLAEHHQVIWQNFGISGARASGVAQTQLPQALKFKPDIVLVAVGANDVTHLSNTHRVQAALEHIISSLQQQRPDVRIVLTGSPDMGSVPRFPWPVSHIADQKTKTINKMVLRVTQQYNVTFAPIAQETGPAFRAHPELFAADKFHPTDEGYDLWTPVIINALDAYGDEYDAR